MSNLYKRIEELCEKKGVSITQMCRESGASRGSLTDLKMKRIGTLNIGTMSKLAVYFNVSIDYLNGSEEKPTPVSESGQSVNIVKIAGRDGTFVEKRLSDNELQKLKAFVDLLPDASDDL